MCKNEPYSVPVNGYLDDVDSITAKDLMDYYQKHWRKMNWIYIFLATSTRNKFFLFVKNNLIFPPYTKNDRKATMPLREKENIVIEKQDVAKGN